MKLTITFMSLLIATISFSQLPTITATNQIPVVEDTMYYSDANSFGFIEDGAGLIIDNIWDYAALTPTGTVTFWYEDATITSDAGLFPNSNMALANSTTAGYEYFQTTGSVLSREGYTSGGATIIYDAPFDRYTFPITPGIIQSSNYTGTMSSFGVGEDSVTIAGGNYQANPDSYGTLRLPSTVFGGPDEVFDDVIRVHVTETFQIKVWIAGVAAVVVNVMDDYYFWFDDETQEPIVIFGTTTDDLGSAPITVLRYRHNVTGTGIDTSSLDEISETAFSVFPNPANTHLNLTFSNAQYRTAILYSVLGEEVATKSISGDNATFNVSKLPQGVYMMEVTTGSNKSIERIIIR